MATDHGDLYTIREGSKNAVEWYQNQVWVFNPQGVIGKNSMGCRIFANICWNPKFEIAHNSINLYRKFFKFSKIIEKYLTFISARFHWIWCVWKKNLWVIESLPHFGIGYFFGHFVRPSHLSAFCVILFPRGKKQRNGEILQQSPHWRNQRRKGRQHGQEFRAGRP